MYKRSNLIAPTLLLLLAVPLTIFSVLQQQDNRSKASTNMTANAGRPFADDSAWNQPIGTNVQLDPKSAEMVQTLAGGEHIADLYEFGTPIYFADASTPKYNIKCTESWGTCGLQSEQVPIPDNAKQAPGSDGQMVIVDLSSRKSYEFWIYKDDKATANWGGILPLDGDGRGTPENSAIGAGTSRLAGIIRTYEIEQGNIEHALVFSSKYCAVDEIRFPAVKTDGKYSGAGAIPEGARVQLDPSLNIDSMSMTKGEKAVAKALQKYGAYVIDCGGAGMAFQFEHPMDKPDPYPAAGLTSDYIEMGGIPWDKMRVLKEWNSYTPVTGGTQPTNAPSITAPTLITPTIYCVGGAGEPPCAPIGTTTTPGAGGGSPGAGTPGVTGGVNPSGGASTPYPSTVEPCQESTSSVMHNKKKKKYKKNRGGGFIERFIRFLIWLIEYILRGGNVPIPTDPSNPCPEPTTQPQPTIEPTSGATPSLAATPTIFGTTPTTAPSTGTIFLGAAVDPDQLSNQAYANALIQNKFTSLTAENAMKFAATEPNQGQFNFDGGDKLVNFAQTNNMRVRGHTLVWHDEREIPGWVNGLSNAAAETALKNHIQTLVTRYKGKVQQWDVVNEAFNDDGTLRDSVWKQKLGDTYIEKAFQWAREADPNAQLFYNDFGTEGIADRGGNKKVKSDAVYNMVKDFKARGIPIDGVGLQTHSAGDYPGTGAEIGENIKRLVALGVKVEITELDVVDPPNGDQAARYAELAKACKDNGCSGITTWGVYDGATWLSGRNPLLLDGNFQPKPAYTSLMNIIAPN